MSVIKDVDGCSAAGVVAGAGVDVSDWVKVSAEVGADSTTADMVYGYLCVAVDMAVKSKYLMVTDAAGGNAVIW